MRLICLFIKNNVHCHLRPLTRSKQPNQGSKRRGLLSAELGPVLIGCTFSFPVLQNSIISVTPMRWLKVSPLMMRIWWKHIHYGYGKRKTVKGHLYSAACSHMTLKRKNSDEYDVSDLKEACHDSLLEDIDAKNVLGRLYNAFLYQLPKLKSGCMQYLVKFGKIYDLGDDLNTFLQSAK
ncbi:hypothetical protein POM88_017525 [Heracleum sosnowskyi]|uniref:Uncharacterized protein n=1 Tax=Heracleum sosnowskyi TaxID=360622 RepID=A0AAD8INU1_9APIA|nr:hypothetical protein POM88_017525 [Heracleum sosnowskyi]